MKKSLKRFWFKFEEMGSNPLNIGCGVSAYNHDDAVALLQERVFVGEALPKIIECIENIDISTLDQNHVIPNMGLVTERGIWFPMGY